MEISIFNSKCWQRIGEKKVDGRWEFKVSGNTTHEQNKKVENRKMKNETYGKILFVKCQLLMIKREKHTLKIELSKMMRRFFICFFFTSLNWKSRVRPKSEVLCQVNWHWKRVNEWKCNFPYPCVCVCVNNRQFSLLEINCEIAWKIQHIVPLRTDTKIECSYLVLFIFQTSKRWQFVYIN